MATIDEVLAGMSSESVTYAIDEVLFINPITRQISIPGDETIFGVEGDGKSERKYFQCPRYVGNDIDLAACLFRVNFQNANGENDFNLINDVAVSEDGNTITFSWELSPKVTAYKGQVKFVICATRPSDNTLWHTTQATGLVLVGLEPDASHIESETADGIAQLVAMVEAQTTAVEAEGAAQVDAVRTAAETAEAAAVAEIKAKGVNTRNSIPADYTALSEAVDTLTRSRAGAIVCEAAGSTVVVNDASDMPIQGLRVFGKTSQVATTGKNLLDMTKEELLVVGTSGAKRYGYSFNGLGTYTFSCIGDNATSITCKIVSNGVFGEYKSFVLTANYTVTLGENDTLLIYRAEENVRLSVGIKNAQIEAGSIATDYEPYSGGKPSPSPEYPQELVSQEPVVSVYGKNLLKPKVKTETVNGVTFTVSEDGSITANGTATKASFFGIGPDLALIPGESYVLSGCPEGGEFDTYMLYLHHKNSGFDVYNRSGETKFTAKDEPFSTVAVVYEGVTVNNLVFQPMLRHSSVEDGSYKAYTEQNISISQALPGIPVTSGGNYTDENGQQWICDEVDLEHGVCVQRIGKIVFDGSRNYHINAYQQNFGYYVFGYTMAGASYSEAPVLADKLKFKPWGYFTVDDIGDYICYESYSFYISLADQSIATVEAFQEYLTAHPVEVQYILATPVETPLSETEIAAYRALRSNYPNTTVLNDSGAHMVVKYAADTKLYIDNKIAALVIGK